MKFFSGLLVVLVEVEVRLEWFQDLGWVEAVWVNIVGLGDEGGIGKGDRGWLNCGGGGYSCF